ncbi:hypothetical protein C0995_007641 [Termitomyces sp. Mi166|nr:hypothetical protein C0995_007641 [Termitomyces sp. Mi166\
MASGPCAAQQNKNSSTLCDPPEYSDTLDSVLRTPLFPHDPEFYELSCRRVAWSDSNRVRLWLLEKGYTLYQRRSSDGDYDAGMYPVNIEHKKNVYPFASHEGPELDGGVQVPILLGNTGYNVCMDLFNEQDYTHVLQGNIAYAQTTQG